MFQLGVCDGPKTRLVKGTVPVGYSRQLETVYTSKVTKAHGSVVFVAMLNLVLCPAEVSIVEMAHTPLGFMYMFPWMVFPAVVVVRELK